MAKFHEHFTYNVDLVSLAGGTGTTFTDASPNLTVSSDADFLFKRTIHNATSNLANLRLQDLATGRNLFKTQEDLRTISGTALSSITANGFVPYNWPKPYMVQRNRQMKVSVADNSGSTNTVRIAFHGEHIWDFNPYPGYDPTDNKRLRMPMTYETTAALVPASSLNAKINGIVRVDDDADFVCTKITGVVTADGQVNLVTQGMSNMHWQNTPTDVNNLIGNSQFPHTFTAPRFIPRNGTIYIEFINLNAGANSLTLQFHGYKLF